MGVVVRRYLDILTITLIFPTPLVLALLLAAASLLLCSFFKCFFGLKNKKPKWRFFYIARRAPKLCHYGDVVHSFYWKSAVEHDGGISNT